ncbi:MAG: trypsin-like peptidase domain-containing protein [Candidatus Omnitrophica bacterium]|nr:trypsin-like peptidase domain-containing protein [Candidatus Omnitrophota bacterium]MDD5429192.1 trypsin-like peptidase domain-containing protein [Candidatus Omnitrophota bacterium]
MPRIFLFAIVSFLFYLPLSAQNFSDLEKATIDIVSGISKAVVSISSLTVDELESKFGLSSSQKEREGFSEVFFQELLGQDPGRIVKGVGLGSGLIIDKEGYILTNEHIISGATKLKVKLHDSREYDAQVKGIDERSDLAVIKINAEGLPVAKLGNSDELKIGSWVFAVGNSFGFFVNNSKPTVNFGVVSSLECYLPALGKREKSYDGLIQTSALVNPGNSGGPLVNIKGEVVGINTAIVSSAGERNGLGFAVPINKAKEILDKLLKGESISYGWLGVTVRDLDSDLRNYFGIKEQEGAVALKVLKDSPAEKGGLKEGDLILSFGQRQVKNTRELIRLVSSSEVGQKVPVRVIRAGKTINLNLTIGKDPQAKTSVNPNTTETSGQGMFRGLSVENLSAENKLKFKIKINKGVIVTGIVPGTQAAKTGIAIGQVILKVENRKIKDERDFKSAVSRVRGDCLIKTDKGYFVLKDE